MRNWKKYINIHIEPQWPLRFKHKCTEIITTVSKKIKYPSSLEMLYGITKRFNTTKYHNTEYRNIPTPKIHQKGKTILHSKQLLPKTHKLPRAKSYLRKGRSHLPRNPFPRRAKPSLPQISLHPKHPDRKLPWTTWDPYCRWNLQHSCGLQ